MISISGDECVRYFRTGEQPAHALVPTNPTEEPIEVCGAVDLGGAEIDGSRVAYGVVFHGDVDLSNCTIKGTIDLTSCVFESELRFDDAEIAGSLRLAGISVLGQAPVGVHRSAMLLLRGVGAIVRGRLDLENARVLGDVALFDAEIHGFLDLRGLHADTVRLRGATVHGDVRLGCGPGGTSELSAVREVNGPDLEIFGRLMMQGMGSWQAEKKEGVAVPYIAMPNARIHGTVIIAPRFTDAGRRNCDFQTSFPVDGWQHEPFITSALGYCNLSGATVQGDLIVVCGQFHDVLNISDATVEGNVHIGLLARSEDGKPVPPASRVSATGLNAARISIGGFLALNGVRVTGDVDLNSMRCRGIVSIGALNTARTEIDGNLELSGSRCESHVQIYSVVVGGHVRLISAKTGTFALGLQKMAIHGATGPAFVGCQVGCLEIYNTEISGTLNLSHLHVLGRPVAGVRGIVINNSRVAGDLRLWQVRDFTDDTDAWLHPDVRPWHKSAAIVGDLRINRCEISGDCVLALVKVSGAIDLADSVITGDLQIASTLTYPVAGDDRAATREMQALDPSGSLLRATCSRLNLRMLRCGNDIDLTGLTVVAGRAELESGSGVGSVSAPYLKVKGDLKMHHAASGHEAYADIPGCIDLSDADAKRLTLSAHSFPHANAPEHADEECRIAGVLLVRARIGVLELPHLPEDERQYPKPIDFEDVAVGVWQIGSGSRDSESDEQRAQRFNRLLQNAAFRRATYKSVEANLRDRGDEGTADRVYRAMRDYESGTGGPFRKFIYRGWRTLLGYGTNAWPLVIVIIGLAAVSLPVYRNPTNFETSLSLLAAQPQSFRDDDLPPLHNASPPLDKWGWADATVMLIHFHIPVVPLSVRTDWDAKDDKGVAYGGTLKCANRSESTVVVLCPGPRRPFFEIRFMAPEDYTTLMEVLNWLLWPLLLSFLIRRVLRQ